MMNSIRPTPLIFCVYLLAATVTAQSATFFQRSETTDMIATSHVLSDTTAASALLCSLACSERECCMAFTFTSSGTETQPGSCRLHDADMMSFHDPTSAEEAVGTTAWSLTAPLPPYPPAGWHQKACTSDLECPADRSTCYLGQCLCLGGYYYAEDTRRCVASCLYEDLTRTFVRYSNTSFSKYCNMYQHQEDTTRCYSTCYIQSWCRTFKVEIVGNNTNRCYFCQTTPLDDPGDWTTGLADGTDFFQRTCGVTSC